jgi:hypothetical protein
VIHTEVRAGRQWLVEELKCIKAPVEDAGGWHELVGRRYLIGAEQSERVNPLVAGLLAED